MPRPTRRRAFLLPPAGLIVLRRIKVSGNSFAHYRNEVADLVDHAADGLRILELDDLADALQPQAAHGGPMVLARASDTLDERHLQSLVRRHHASKISSTVLPRLAAMSAGALPCSSALIVARTTLYGLVGPWHFARMLVTPTTSNTARIAPPAITPVPSDAGCMYTTVEPCLPMTAWCRVPFFRRTFTIFRRACSIAFCSATGTSFALPLPMPMRPSPSPTTVSAAKPRIRPPFTTLVTRLIEIIFSFNPSPRSSCCCGWRGLDRCCAMYEVPCSELEA